MFFDCIAMPPFDEASYFQSEMMERHTNPSSDFSSYHLGFGNAARFSPVHLTLQSSNSTEFDRNATVNRDSEADGLSQHGKDEDFEFDESSLFDEDSNEKYHTDDNEPENDGDERPATRGVEHGAAKTTRYHQTPIHRRRLNNCPFQPASLPVQIVKNSTNTAKARSNADDAFDSGPVIEPSSLATYQRFCGRRDVEIPENIPPPDQMFLWMQELTRRTYEHQSELIFGELPPPRTRKGAARHFFGSPHTQVDSAATLC